MINLPCNAASMSQVTPCQNVPVQTSQYNFPTCQQRQTSTQQMQTAACGSCSGTSQGGPFAHVCQPDTYIVTHQCAPGTLQPITNPCHPIFQNLPSPIHPGCGQLPQNILDQIRACVSNAAPIFILPNTCQAPQQQQQQQQQQPPPPSMPPFAPQIASSPPAAYPPSGLTYPAACYPPPPPPPFYPYPVPLPFCDPFIRSRETVSNCGCCRKGDVDSTEIRNVLRAGCRYDAADLEEHRCAPTLDDAICSKRNCPSSLHLQALASQFLSMQGIIPCAATRLVLRKVPGSNVTTTMEDTMARAQKAISVLTKDQLLTESRNAQQVNTLINLHMTANPPPNIIPILTLVQLKMNLLKAQVEGLVNQKIMEIQGVGTVEVETDLIDPTILALKSDAELRDFLSALRQKECDERVNVNFAPYRSQRAIAETRLSNVQNKIRQVEAEFDRRRCAMLPAPTLSSRVVQQFSRPCYSARFEDPRRLYGTLPPEAPRMQDPFTYVQPRSPKRLLLKACTGKAEATVARPPVAVPAAAGTRGKNPHKNPDDGSGKEQPAPERQRSSTENCACCDRSTSEESVGEAKKKLRPRIVEIDAATIGNAEGLEREALSLVRLTSNVCVRRFDAEECEVNAQKYEEGNETGGIPCSAKCWTAEAYVNVADDKWAKTFAESESDTVMLSEKIDAEDVCEARDVVEIRRCDQTTDQREFGSPSNSRPFKKRARDEITISERDEAITGRDVEIKSPRDVPPPEADREEVRATTTAQVASKDSISSMQEMEGKSSDDIRTSSLNVILKPKKVRGEDEQEDKNDKILPSAVDAAVEQSTSQAPMSKSKKKIRFHVVSLMTNIVYDESRKYGRKQKNEKEIATSEREMSITTDPEIEKLNKCSSIENLLGTAVARNITGKDHSENIFSKGLNLPKLRFDHQCQATFKEDKNTTAALLETNIFPPFKNPHKYVTDNEKNGDDVGTPSPITKAGITTTKRLSHCNDIIGSTLETVCKNNVPYHSDVEREGNLISKLFSVIGNRVIAFINKIIAMNRRLLYSICNAIVHKSLIIDIFRRDVPIGDHSELISQDYNLSASTSHYSSGLNYKTPRISRHDFRNTNSLRISTKKGKRERCNGIRKIKHLIIEDQKNDTRYLLIDTPRHNRDLILTRDLGRPYKVQKSLLIHSRLKNSLNSQDYPHPFSLLKRIGENVLEFHQTKCNENVGIRENEIRELKSSEKFWTLSEIVKTNGINEKISEMREYDNESKEQFLNEYSYDDIKYNNVSTVRHTTVVDNNAADNEFVISVHDYLGLQTEINTNIYENRRACLLISSN